MNHEAEPPKTDWPCLLMLLLVAAIFSLFAGAGCAAKKHPRRLPSLINGNN